MLSKMFQRGASSVSRPEVRRATTALLQDYVMSSSGLLSSIRRMMFSQNRKNDETRDYKAQFAKFKKFSKEQEEQDKKQEGDENVDSKTEETYQEEIRRKQQQRDEESEEAFKQQQERLKDKFHKTKDKDQLSFFDVFSDVKEELGNRLKASGEFMSRTSSKLSERAAQAKESLKKKETTEQQGEKEEKIQTQEEEKTEEMKASEAKEEEVKDEPVKEQKKSEEVQYNEDRRSYAQRIGDRLSSRTGNLAKKVEESSPGLYRVTHSISSSFTRYWDMTFPNYEKKAMNKMTKLKQEGEQVLSQEELEKIQSQIPEWKRSALQISEEKNPQKRRSMLRNLRQKMSEKVRQTEQYKKLKQRDEYKKYEEFKDDLKEFRENLKEEVEASPNKFVSVSRQLYDRAKSDSPFAKALLKMRQRDPEFQIESLKAQIPYIVHPLYAQYLEDNIQYLEKCCEDHALGYLKSRIKARHNRKVIPKYKVPIFVDEAYFLGGKLGEKGVPQFIYSIRIEEINCFLCKNNPEEIKEGDDDSILGSHFRLTVEPHESPDLQLMGHYWKFVEFEKIQETEMLV